MKKIKTEKGFTLVETLITLLIAAFLLLLPVLSLQQTIRNTAVDMFFRELSSNITLMQNHAILAGENTMVEFAPRANVIRFKVLNADSGSNHPLDREISLAESPCEFVGTEFQTVYFKRDTGNIAMMYDRWRIKFQTDVGVYELVFKIGSGRFDIRKI